MTSKSYKNFVKKQFKEVVTENPGMSKEEVAERLGVSLRTVYRYCKDYNIQIPDNKMTAKERKCVKYLESIGYTFE